MRPTADFYIRRRPIVGVFPAGGSSPAGYLASCGDWTGVWQLTSGCDLVLITDYTCGLWEPPSVWVCDNVCIIAHLI